MLVKWLPKAPFDIQYTAAEASTVADTNHMVFFASPLCRHCVLLCGASRVLGCAGGAVLTPLPLSPGDCGHRTAVLPLSFVLFLLYTCVGSSPLDRVEITPGRTTAVCFGVPPQREAERGLIHRLKGFNRYFPLGLVFRLKMFNRYFRLGLICRLLRRFTQYFPLGLVCRLKRFDRYFPLGLICRLKRFTKNA